METTLIKLEKKHETPVMGSSINSCKTMKKAPVLVLIWNTRDSFSASRLEAMMRKISQVMPDSARADYLR